MASEIMGDIGRLKILGLSDTGVLGVPIRVSETLGFMNKTPRNTIGGFPFIIINDTFHLFS